LTNAADVLQATKTVTLGGAYSSSDFSFTRTITAGSNTLGGNVVSIQSTGTASGTNNNNILYLNEGSSGTTSGNLILAQKGGSDRFKVDTSGNTTVSGTTTSTGLITGTAGVSIAAGQSCTGAGAVTLSSGAGTALTITGNAASTWSTTSGALTMTSAAAATWGTTTGNLTLSAGGANTVIAKAGSNSTATFQVQNASSSTLFNADTTNGRINVGSTSTDATAVLLTLDSYNQSSDPTGVNGAMYYNTSMNAFRCYENGAWYNCLTHHTVTLGSDVTNNNGSANTISDVTGLSFSVTSGTTYRFRAVIAYTSAATTTGSRWAINGPATSLLNYTSNYTLTATTQTINYASAYDTPSASNATSLTAGNVAVIEGVVTPSASGTVVVRFASEVSSSAITAKAGSTLEWW
jgi:hypothetical protein